MHAEEHRVKCPTCGKSVVRSPQSPAPFFPFCCERCKLIDLGKWFGEEYRIEGPAQPEDGSEPEPRKGD